MKTLLLSFLLAASAATAAPLDAVLVNTNGVQVAPAMLTLTNVVIVGFNFEDITDLDISGRSIDDVIAWDGTNHVYVAQGGHDPLTLGAGDIGSLTNQVRTVTTNNVLNALALQTIRPSVISPASGSLSITGPAGVTIAAGGSNEVTIESATIIDGNLDVYNDLTVAGDPVLTDASDLNAANLTNLVITVPVSDWHGPRDTERPGWAYKSYATTNTTTRLCAGMFEYGTTQYTATLDAYFTVPAEATDWATTAITLKLLGDSTTSSDVKYRLYCYRDGTTAAIFDSTANQVLTSTSAITTVSIPGSSLGAISPGTTYTIRLEPSVRNSLALYIHSITVQVIK